MDKKKRNIWILSSVTVSILILLVLMIIGFVFAVNTLKEMLKNEIKIGDVYITIEKIETYLDGITPKAELTNIKVRYKDIIFSTPRFSASVIGISINMNSPSAKVETPYFDSGALEIEHIVLTARLWSIFFWDREVELSANVFQVTLNSWKHQFSINGLYLFFSTVDEVFCEFNINEIGINGPALSLKLSDFEGEANQPDLNDWKNVAIKGDYFDLSYTNEYGVSYLAFKEFEGEIQNRLGIIGEFEVQKTEYRGLYYIQSMKLYLGLENSTYYITRKLQTFWDSLKGKTEKGKFTFDSDFAKFDVDFDETNASQYHINAPNNQLEIPISGYSTNVEFRTSSIVGNIDGNVQDLKLSHNFSISKKNDPNFGIFWDIVTDFTMETLQKDFQELQFLSKSLDLEFSKGEMQHDWFGSQMGLTKVFMDSYSLDDGHPLKLEVIVDELELQSEPGNFTAGTLNWTGELAHDFEYVYPILNFIFKDATDDLRIPEDSKPFVNYIEHARFNTNLKVDKLDAKSDKYSSDFKPPPEKSDSLKNTIGCGTEFNWNCRKVIWFPKHLTATSILSSICLQPNKVMS